MTDWTARDAAARERRQKLRRRRKWDNRLANLLAGLMILGGALGVIALYAALSGLSVYAGWNLGAVGISHALGGHVHSISFLTAIGAGLLIGTLSRIFGVGSQLKLKLKS